MLLVYTSVTLAWNTQCQVIYDIDGAFKCGRNYEISRIDIKGSPSVHILCGFKNCYAAQLDHFQGSVDGILCGMKF